MYGLPDSMVVGMAKRGKRLLVEKNKMERFEADMATLDAVVMIPFAVASGVLGGITKFANFVERRSLAYDRKARAKRAKAKLKKK